jgi:hypothetical protein
MKRPSKKPTKAESARMDRISRLRCVACWDTGLCCGKTEVHHLTSGGRRRGHAYSVPMGIWHHRGIPLSGSTTEQMRLFFGPSLRLESKAFHEAYGDDDALLAKVNSLLGEAA